MRVDENCDVLFEYLKSILYDANIHTLNLDRLDEPFKKLGQGLQVLEQEVIELKECSSALSKGEFDSFHPSRDNFLCSELKNIHANLEHLTWQAKQVSKGDYSQNVSYLGEFSTAFNTMTAQLKEREQALKKEAETLKKHSNSVETYNRLLLELIHHSNDDILVCDRSNTNILYSSRNLLNASEEKEIIHQFSFILSEKGLKQEWSWDTMDSNSHFYHVISILTEWQQKDAYAHFIRDVTNVKKKEKELQKKAYIDALTQISNRDFFMREMNRVLEKKEDFVLCYCDLDQLKYVNDTFGHVRGDQYICDFVNCVKENICDYAIFARVGGDEFCLLFTNFTYEDANHKMMTIQKEYAKKSLNIQYCFSYGCIYKDKNQKNLNVEDLLKEADYVMYQQKREHRKARR